MKQALPHTATWQDLAKNIEGEVFFPGDAGYERAMQRSFNKMPLPSLPEVVCCPKGAADVSAIVIFAQGMNKTLSILNGGQNPSRASYSGQVVLDMSFLSHVCLVPSDTNQHSSHPSSLDSTPDVLVGAGCTFRHLDRELALRGLCLPGPLWSPVGVAGCALGGGWGFLSRQLGMVCDAVRQVEAVTATGEVVEASDKSHRDLFWAAVRGAGAGTLAVVTSLRMKTWKAPLECWHGTVAWKWTEGPQKNVVQALAKSLRKHREKWPSSTVMYPIMEASQMLLLVFCSAGESVGKPLLDQVLAEVPKASEVNVIAKSYVEVQRAFDNYFVPQRCFQRARFLTELSDEIIWMCASRLVELPENAKASTKILLQSYFEDSSSLLLVSASWSDETLDQSVIHWSNSMVEDATKEEDLGGAPNFAPRGSALSELFSEEDKTRLLRVKHQYDPDDFFSFNVLKFRPHRTKK